MPGVVQLARLGYSATYPTDFGMVLLPSNWRGDGTVYPLIATHGATAFPWVFTDGNQNAPAAMQLLQGTVREFGRPAFCPYNQGDQFGNAISTACIDDAIGYMASQFGCKPGKAALLGESMGAGECFSYANQHPDKVTSITGIIPLSNLLTIWLNNRAGVTASINAAAGGTYVPATNGPMMDPNVFGANLGGIPVDLWYSSDDTVVLPAEVQALAALIGTSVQLNPPLTGAHGDAAVSTLTLANRQAIGEFIRANANGA